MRSPLCKNLSHPFLTAFASFSSFSSCRSRLVFDARLRPRLVALPLVFEAFPRFRGLTGDFFRVTFLFANVEVRLSQTTPIRTPPVVFEADRGRFPLRVSARFAQNGLSVT